VLCHEIFTNGIAYVRLIFNLNNIPAEYFPYIGVLKGVLGLLNTKNYAYGDLFNEMNIVTGGIAAAANVYGNIEDMEQYTVTLEIKTKVLYNNIDKAIALIKEIILSSDYTDEKRIYEILAEGKSRVQSQMTSSGHSVTASRAMSYGSTQAAISETLSGISFYRLISDITENYEEKKKELSTILAELAEMIFRKENLMIDYVGTQEGYDLLTEPVGDLMGELYENSVKTGSFKPEVVCKNEGFTTSGQVQFVCRAGNFRKKGLKYRGDLKVLRVMMGYEYLWMNIRVKGGAYGCMCNFGRTGDSYFVSYRDPNLKNTVTVYEEAATAIAEFEADERTMTQYIIGAISDLDVPMNPAAKGLFSLSAYMTGLTEEILQKERDELLSASEESIRSLSEYVSSFMEDNYLCVVGSKERIEEEENLFFHVENLL
ncbi:insulinase family protein, partial [Lachnospiraceae bacterium OttesenSCG-928-D06]|nr:insulinase family protein [Lachnospiraceae bacterium OttesenSCG-928-D06]